jgi:hypothetical protein
MMNFLNSWPKCWHKPGFYQSAGFNFLLIRLNFNAKYSTEFALPWRSLIGVVVGFMLHEWMGGRGCSAQN